MGTTPRIESLLRRANGRAPLAPLLRALGFEPQLTVLPPSAWAAFGLGGIEGVDALVIAGERDGVTALLVEWVGEPSADGVARVARRARAHNVAQPYLFLLAGTGYRRLVIASFGLDGELRQLGIERRRPRRTDVEALEEMAAPGADANGVALVLCYARALDRSRITRQFFRDFKAQRARVSAAWLSVPESLGPERDQLALLLLSRLMFLYFLQRRGHLAGDPEYVPALFRRWRQGGVAGGRGAGSAQSGNGAGISGGSEPAGPGGEARVDDGPDGNAARPNENVEALGKAKSFHQSVLKPLFFGALNTRPESRTPEAMALGPLPYLNGGLFERHALERRYPELDLPDDVVGGIFDDLLDHYRFTTHDAAESTAGGSSETGVDPEMLGRVFEELMAGNRRGATGTFYTPAAVVDRLVRTALKAHLVETVGIPGSTAAALMRGEGDSVSAKVRGVVAERLTDVRVLDPACGSGAFLLGVLSRLSRLRASVEGGEAGSFRREIVGRALHGVDLQDDAALLCALRLWLAFAVGPESAPSNREAGPESVPPLPNLDRRIRQGDALIDPLDLIAGGWENSGGGTPDAAPWRTVAVAPAVRRAVRALGPLTDSYLSAGPEEKPELQGRLVAAEAALAMEWLRALELRLSARIAELRAHAASLDLFGQPHPDARTAEAGCGRLVDRAAELAHLRAGLEDSGTLPFFSFRVHFAEAAAKGFDLVLSNPPWVRAHRWPAPVRRLVRRSYAVCRGAGWRHGARLAGAPAGVGGQVDLALLFLERSLRLLAPGGTLGTLLPAKAFRSLYGAGARRLLIRETRLVALEDHSLDQRSIFRADAFAATVVAIKDENPIGRGRTDGHRKDEVPVGGGRMNRCRKDEIVIAGGSTNQCRPGSMAEESMGSAGGAISGLVTDASGDRDASLPGNSPACAEAQSACTRAHNVRITMIRRDVDPLRFAIPQDDLSIVPGDPDAPWLLAPPGVRAALRRMQCTGPPLGSHPGLRVHRGALTGANDVMVVRQAEAKLGDHARITAEGYFRARRDGRPASAAGRYRALIEASALRPMVRGSGISAWRYTAPEHLIWTHDDESARPRTAPPLLERYLARHGPALRARSGWRPSLPTGAIFRVTPDTLRCKVAWHDLAETLNAVALPARVRSLDGVERPLIPLNTVYFVPTEGENQSLLLAAFLNSLPLRTFARSIAERAKDARFRFFAWTVALLPLPGGWDSGAAAEHLIRISRAAHARGSLSPGRRLELDTAVAARYGLTADDLRALADFDAWLRGEASV